MNMTASRLGLALALLPLAAGAQIIIDDNFNDGDRLNSNLPNSATWYSSASAAASVVRLVDTGGGNYAMEISGTTAARQAATFFNPVTLAVDEQIVVSFDFTPTANFTGADSVLRVALVNGATPQTADGQISGLMTGYSVWVNSGTNALRFRERDPETSGGIINSAPSWTGRDTATPDSTFAWGNGQTYAVTFSVQRVSDTAVNLVYSITGDGNSFRASWLDESATAFQFNALGFALHNSIDTGLIDNVKLEVVPIPEPAELTFLASAFALGWLAFIRRRG